MKNDINYCKKCTKNEEGSCQVLCVEVDTIKDLGEQCPHYKEANVDYPECLESYDMEKYYEKKGK